MKNTRVPRTVVPDTIEGIAGLLTARRWEKAAIVYAWTRPDTKADAGRKGGSKREIPSASLYSLKEFADLGIGGLIDPGTVSAYRQAWVWAIEHGLAEMVGPGDEINLDDLETVTFPGPTGHAAYAQTLHDDAYEAEAEAAGISADAAKRAGSNKKAIEAAVVADPEVAQAAARGLDKRYRKQAEERKQRVTDRMGPPAENTGFTGHGTVLDRAVDMLDAAVEEAGRREQIRHIQAAAAAIKAAAENLVAEHHHTGVTDEVEWLHEITANLTEAQWALTGFIVENEAAK